MKTVLKNILFLAISIALFSCSDEQEKTTVPVEEETIEEKKEPALPTTNKAWIQKYISDYSTLQPKFDSITDILITKKVEVLDTNSIIPILRKKLTLLGDLKNDTSATSEVYDPLLVNAVKNFQKRHGLNADGVLGKRTVSHLNTKLTNRINTLKINLEKTKLDTIKDSLYILVNIPAMEMKLIENNKEKLKMRTIVGTTKRETASFSGLMTYIEFNPYWTVPSTIFKEDKLPKIRKDPNYLAKNNFILVSKQTNKPIQIDSIDWNAESFPFKLRQNPGKKNALGTVKFMFPNKHYIYIHDTPDRRLFKKDARYFSSGCIRIEHPKKLAELLLKKNNWDLEKIEEVIESRENTKVSLKQPLKVYIQYRTAWVENGIVNFRKDNYKKDGI